MESALTNTQIAHAGPPGNKKPQKYSREGFSRVDPTAAGRAVYSDGLDRVGHVVDHGHEILAFDRMGNPVGSFPDIIAAVAALGGAARVRS